MTETRSDTHSRWALLRTTLATQRRNLTIATLIGLLWMCGKVAVPWLVGIGIDRGIEADDRVWLWSGLVAAAGVASGIFTAFRRYYAFREARWTETKLREQLFGHILRLHIGYHDRSQTGQLMSRSSSDLQQIQAFVVMIPITLSNLAMVISVTVILALTNPLLTVVALAPLPLVNFAGRRFSSSIHPAVQAVQQEQAELATVVEETVSGVRVIKGFGAESVQSAKLEVEADDIRRVSIDAAKIRAKYLPAIELLPQIGLIGVLGVGGLQVIDGTLTLGELVSFNIYVALLVAPLRMLGMTIAWGQRAAAALKRINEVLDTVPLITDPEQPTALPTAQTGSAQTGSAQTGSPQRCAPMGAVRFDRVEFGYDDDLPVLKNFNLELAAGQSIALVGGTGSGKSTVARLLIRFYDAEAGSITIDGVPIGDLALHELRRAVGVVFEDTLLFHDSVAANIAFADPAASHDAIERAARLAGAHDFIVGLPDAYETELGERGYSLSGGQRQRIAIARAILADPRILVLDDATSAVDPSKEHEIRSAMSTVMDGRTTIVIAHRPGTIALADTVALVDEGRVIATGTHDHLLATDARYREVLAAMSDADRAAAGPTGSGRS
jgi:ATP-binding cassette subfamily B protein